MQEEDQQQEQRAERLRLTGSRPRGGEWPACLTDEEFDCEACEFVEPSRCDLRVDETFLEFRRRNNYFARPEPRRGLQREAHTVLLEAGPLDYHEVAQRVSAQRESPVSAVTVLTELQSAASIFFPLGQGRFMALANRTDFDQDTDNVWYRLPAFDEDAPTRARRAARRYATATFLSGLGERPRVIDAIRAVFGDRKSGWPTSRELDSAAEAAGDDTVRRGGTEFIAQQSRLSPKAELESEIDVAYWMRAGQEAFQAMVSDSLRLVLDYATRYVGRGSPLVDLCQEGVLGLMRAAEKYNPERGSFSTYAVWWIWQAITRAAADQGRLIRVPVHLYEKSPWLRRAHDPGPIPAAALPTLRPMVSLDELPESRHPTVGWTDEIDERSSLAAVREALSKLTQRQADVLRLRFGLDDGRPRTLEEVGVEFGVTRERIRQIQDKALRRLSHPARKLHKLLDPSAASPKAPRPMTVAALPRLNDTERYLIARRFGLRTGKPATIAELAKEVDATADAVMWALRRALSRIGPEESAALNQTLYGVDPHSSANRALLASLERELGDIPRRPPKAPGVLPTVAGRMNELTQMERTVVSMRLGLRDGRPQFLREIADALGRSRDQVRNDLISGLAKFPRELLTSLEATTPLLAQDIPLVLGDADDDLEDAPPAAS